MSKRLSIYYTQSFASVDVENGACRQYSSSSMVETLNSMTPEDLKVLVGFCQAVLNYTQGESNNVSYNQLQRNAGR